MKIWIDLTNSPHINFFAPFIDLWGKGNYEVVITTRDLANTIDLIKRNNWDYKEIGGHAGKNIVKKIFFFPLRVYLLLRFLRSVKPDIGISHSSFYSPLVCKILGILSIYINDNEHAKGNYLAFRFSSVNLLPEALKKKAEEVGWIKKFNIKFYPGIKEGVYLSQAIGLSKQSTKIKADTIFVRLEPWTAQYYSSKKFFLDKILLEIANDYKVIILPRGKEQMTYYQNKKFNKIIVQEKALTIEEIYHQCLLFIGAGGSMTREMAYLGIPTISVYQDKLLEVDKFLIEKGHMLHFNSLDKNIIDERIKRNSYLDNNLLKLKGNEAFLMIAKLVENFEKN